MKKSTAIGIATLSIATLGGVGAGVSFGAQTDNSCWDEYDVSGEQLFRTVVLADNDLEDCEPGDGCFYSYRSSDNKKVRWLIPHGEDPATACGDDPDAPTTTVGGTGGPERFGLVGPGSELPTDEECASWVRPMSENRPENAAANATPGTAPNGRYPRVTGNFTGTTDEIIQWTACKWGIDEDMVRAQIVLESGWNQHALGDFTSNPEACSPTMPIGDYSPQYNGDRDHAGECPESVGLGQVRFIYHQEAFEEENAIRSSAYNLDYTYAGWRSCFEGELAWLNQVNGRGDYAAGDPIGCMGVWYSGRWYTDAAVGYIGRVQEILNAKSWLAESFPPAVSVSEPTPTTEPPTTPPTTAPPTTAPPTTAPPTTAPPTTPPPPTAPPTTEPPVTDPPTTEPPGPVGGDGRWLEVDAGGGSLNGARRIFVPDESEYPNSDGMSFWHNGSFNRTDTTGRREGSEFHLYPAPTLRAGDELRAEWTDESGARREATYTVPQPEPTPQPKSEPPSSDAFVATFDDGSDDINELFDIGVFHRERDAFDPPRPQWVGGSWGGDHDETCGPPEDKRTLTIEPLSNLEEHRKQDAQSFYQCKNHMMTSMGHVSGYSIAAFWPKQNFTSISRVCWDVNLSSDILGHRQWWEVAVSPAGAPRYTAIWWIAGTANLQNYGDAEAVVLGFGPDNPPYHKLSIGNDSTEAAGMSTGTARKNLRLRVPHCLSDRGDGTLLFTFGGVGDVPYQEKVLQGSFPDGPLQVTFKDHNYTPNKDCGHMPGGRCQSFSWHWDNIVVEP